MVKQKRMLKPEHSFLFTQEIQEEYSPIAAICPVLHMADGYKRINDMNGTERSDKRVASSD